MRTTLLSLGLLFGVSGVSSDAPLDARSPVAKEQAHLIEAAAVSENRLQAQFLNDLEGRGTIVDPARQPQNQTNPSAPAAPTVNPAAALPDDANVRDLLNGTLRLD